MNVEEKPYPKITQAIRSGNLNEVVNLFGKFPEMKHLNVPGFSSWLHYAAAHGNLELVEYLIDQGFSVNAKDEEGRGPIAHSAAKGRIEITKRLIEKRAALDVSESVSNPLFGAIIGRSSQVATLLLDAGVDTEASYRFSPSSPAHLDAIAFAMMHGEADIARLIALHRYGGDELRAREAVEAGLALARNVTEPSAG